MCRVKTWFRLFSSKGRFSENEKIEWVLKFLAKQAKNEGKKYLRRKRRWVENKVK